MIALRDAMIIMRRTIVVSSTIDSEISSMFHSMSRNKLETTTRNLANACSRRQWRIDPTTRKSCSELLVHTISQNDAHTVPGTIVKETLTSNNVVFPIRIETMSKYSTQQRHLDMVSSIIFYNYGIVHLCLCSLQAYRREAQTNHEQAMLMFDISLGMIQKYLCLQKIPNSLLVTLVTMKCTYSMLLLGSTETSLSPTKDEMKCNNNKSSLLELVHAAQRMEQIMEQYMSKTQVAA